MKYSFAGLIKDVDANGDGKVTREELSNAVEKVKASGIGAAPGMFFLLFILRLLPLFLPPIPLLSSLLFLLLFFVFFSFCLYFYLF